MFHQSLEPGGFLALDADQVLPPSFVDRFPRVEAGLPLFQKPEA